MLANLLQISFTFSKPPALAIPLPPVCGTPKIKEFLYLIGFSMDVLKTGGSMLIALQRLLYVKDPKQIIILG